MNNERDLSYSFSFVEGVVHILVKGVYIQTESTDGLKELIKNLEDNNCTKCLVDYSIAEMIIKPLITYNRTGQAIELEFKKNNKVAFLFKEINKELEFFENVFVNKGFITKIFVDRNEALNWLNN